GMAGLGRSAPTEKSKDAGDVVLRLSERRNTAKSIDCRLPRIVRSERKRQIVPGKQLLEMLNTSFHVYFRIEKVQSAILPARCGHKLHQPPGALWGDGAAVISRLDLDERADDSRI